MANPDYASAIALAYRMTTEPDTYSAFKSAMLSGSSEFASWLSKNGVPQELADKLSTQTGGELSATLGDVLCEEFW